MLRMNGAIPLSASYVLMTSTGTSTAIPKFDQEHFFLRYPDFYKSKANLNGERSVQIIVSTILVTGR